MNAASKTCVSVCVSFTSSSAPETSLTFTTCATSLVRSETVAASTGVGLPFADIVLPAPAAAAQRRPRAVTSFGRVHFRCPACYRSTALPTRHCGERVSCPKCFTGIRVPDPARNLSAQNLGRTLDPILRPEDFVPCVDRSRLLPWLISRLPSPAHAVTTAGVVLLLAVTGGLSHVTLDWANYDRIAALQHSATLWAARPSSFPEDPAKAAEVVVREFLAATSPVAKAAYVTNPSRTAPLLVDWYARRPGGGAQPEAVITTSSEGYYADPSDSTAVSEVTVESPGLPDTTYCVEHRPEGPRIAWEQSVGYSPLEWKELLRQPEAKVPIPLRLLACADNYYNNSFGNERDFLCLRLHDPQTLEMLGYGYLPRPAVSITPIVPAAGASEPLLLPVTLAVLAQRDSVTTRQVRIVGPVYPGWKIERTSTLAQR